MRLSYGFNIEPPDQGLCANNHYVVESVNLGIVQVYSSSTLQPVANGFATLTKLMGLTSHGSGWSSGGDVMCNFDSANGGHWFFTQFVSTTPGAGGFFSGCVFGVPDTCREGIAVSQTSNPMGAYNVYFLDPNYVNNDPGSASNGGPTILNDFAKQGLTANAFLLFYNEYNDVAAGLAGPSGFNGAQEFAFSKTALETGASASSVNVVYENMAVAANIYPIPASASFQPLPGVCDPNANPATNFDLCWIGVIPAQTPDPSHYDKSNGGTAWMVASLDLIGFGDDRVATFTFTGLCNLDSSCASPTTVKFGGTLYETPQIVYMDEGFACPIQFGGFCGLATQKAGPIPLGDNCGNPIFADSVIAASCPESGLATNGDETNQASYAHGQIWAAVSTLVTQSFRESNEMHVGAAFWAIGSSSVSAGGIVSAAHEDILFPSIAATDGGSALMSFTLSGPDFFPSSAYTWLTNSQSEGNEGNTGTIHVTALGQAPQDGFTQYLFYPNDPRFRPRWGDYGAAIFVPSHEGHGSIYFTSEYIQYPNCSDQTFLSIAHSGIRCDGTRASSSNWGTSINSLASS
jgi:hypothetical protein